MSVFIPSVIVHIEQMEQFGGYVDYRAITRQCKHTFDHIHYQYIDNAYDLQLLSTMAK